MIGIIAKKGYSRKYLEMGVLKASLKDVFLIEYNCWCVSRLSPPLI
jgi:hypothetical protein